MQISLKLFRDIGAQFSTAFAQAAMVWLYALQGRTQKVETLAKEISWPADTRPSMQEMQVTVYLAVNEPEKALVAANQLFYYWQTRLNQEGRAEALQTLGNVYLAMGDEERAEQSYKQSLTIYELLGRRDRVADLYLSLFTLRLAQKRTTEAMSYLTKACDIYRQLQDRINLLDCLTTKAISLASLHEWDSVASLAIEILRLADAERYAYWKAQAAAIKQGALTVLSPRSRESLAKSIKAFSEVAETLESLGQLKQALEQYESLARLYKMAQDRSGEAQAKAKIKSIQELLNDP